MGAQPKAPTPYILRCHHLRLGLRLLDLVRLLLFCPRPPIASFFLSLSFFFSFFVFFDCFLSSTSSYSLRGPWCQNTCYARSRRRLEMRGDRRGVARRSGLESGFEGEEELEVEVGLELELELQLEVELELELTAAAPVDPA